MCFQIMDPHMCDWINYKGLDVLKALPKGFKVALATRQSSRIGNLALVG